MEFVQILKLLFAIASSLLLFSMLFIFSLASRNVKGDENEKVRKLFINYALFSAFSIISIWVIYLV